MACKKYKENIILHLYGELNEEDSKELLKHIKECSDCKEDFAYTKKVFRALDETKIEGVPEANWEKCWGVIEPGIREKKRRTWGLPLFPRWAYATAALVLVFAVGLFVGRTAFFQPGAGRSQSLEGPQSAMYPSVQEHLDNLTPLLVEYANYTPSPDDGKIAIDRKLVRSLIIQNILLKRMIAEKNPNLAQLLEDVDLVLREIANRDEEDPETLSMIKELIQQRGILYEIEVSKTL
jgi:hypothetical protein